VNDHLPDDISDPDQIEDIIRMINDMGITVYETAPGCRRSARDRGEHRRRAAPPKKRRPRWRLVETEAGRTTDPVRMYMREMGTVELLTREGEIAIAKRIEEGAETEETVEDAVALLGDDDEEGEAASPAGDSGPSAEEVAGKVEELRARYQAFLAVLEQHGRGHDEARVAAARAAEVFLQFKLLPNIFDSLVEGLRETIANIRGYERTIMDLCVEGAKMPRKSFINAFLENETNLDWLPRQIGTGAGYSGALKAYAEDILEMQRKLLEIRDQGDQPPHVASAKPRPAAPRRTWSRPTCAW
jgi:RNA polymerase primary sigma factor